VRHIGNFARGKFGSAIGREFARWECQVTLLCSCEAAQYVELVGWGDKFHEIITFRFFEDFEEKLFGILRDDTPDIVLMAAAVSDYVCADVVDGKISSNFDEMMLRLVRTPKLIAKFRQVCGIKTFLVGFKLLVGATDDGLVTAARDQVVKNRLNLCVANDLDKIKGDDHPITIVTPEGGAIPIDGKREDVAAELVSFILRRYDVAWSQSVQAAGPAPVLKGECSAGNSVSCMLDLTREANIFDGPAGNLSWRVGEKMLTSPRKVDKRTLELGDMISVIVDLDDRIVFHRGERKASIDTLVHAGLYERFDWLHGLLHFHDGFVLPDARTSFPYPCGTVEETAEIVRVLDEAGKDEPFAVELVNHGYLVGLPKHGEAELIADWQNVKELYLAHLHEVGVADSIPDIILRPVFVGWRIAGVVGQHRTEEWVSFYLAPDWQGGGLGDALVAELDRQGLTVKTITLCAVENYYTARGWLPVNQPDASMMLIPPSKRDDVREAVTMCVVNPATREVLLGQRKTATWHGMWAMVGGEVDPGEEGQPELTAWREAMEEVAMEPFPAGQMVDSIVSTVSTNGGHLAYRVTTLIYFVEAMPAVSESDELRPEVFTLEQTRDLAMGVGTKRVLRHVEEMLS